MTEARRGVDHYRAGAHLPVGPRARAAEDHGPADPAAGELVRRCRSCGMPDRPRWRVIDFRLRMKFGGVMYDVIYTICERCILDAGARPRADPLDVQTP